MSVRPLQVFVSSKMQELADERRAVKTALDDMRIESFVFEADAGARPQTIEETFLEEVEGADLYIGVFWRGYGRYTIEEYDRAAALGMDCLIYEKREAVDGQRDPELAAFLEGLGDVEAGLTVKWFHTPAQLADSVKDDVARWQAEKIREAQSPRGTRLFIDVPRTPPHFDGRDEHSLSVVRSLKTGHDLAIAGLPGVGKTTFTAAIARHKGVLRHFRDGTLWGSVGPAGDADRVLVAWAAALAIPIGQPAQSSLLPDQLREAIGSRSVLIIIDDVWQLEAAKLLRRVSGPNCVILLTTRDLGIARSFAGTENVVELPPLEENAAFTLLRRLAPEACMADENRARTIAKGAGGLPLALELIGGFLAAPENSLFRELRESAFDQISDVSQRLQLAFTRLGGVGARDVTLRETIVLSLTGVPQAAIDAFFRLGAFAPKPATFGLDAAKAVAGVDAGHLALLVARQLLTSVGDDRLELHQVLADAANDRAITDRRASQLEHSRYYGKLASAALRAYAQNNEGRTPGPGTAAYRREQQQIDAAVAWLMSQQLSNETDDVLVDFAQARQFMPMAAFYEQSEDARVRDAAISAAGRAGRQDAKARLLLAASMHAGVMAKIAKMRGRLKEAARLYRSALEMAEQTRDLPKDWSSFLPGDLGRSYSELLGDANTFHLLSELTAIHLDLSERQDAIRYGEQSLTLAQSARRKDWECAALGVLGGAYSDAGQNERALVLLEQRLNLLTEASAKADDRAETLGNLGVLAFRLDRDEQATSYLEQALKVAEEAGLAGIVRASVSLLATLCERAGKPDDAIRYLLHQREIVHLEAGHMATKGKTQAEILAGFFGAAQIDQWRSRLFELCKEEAQILDRLGRLLLYRPEPDLTAAIAAFTQAVHVNEELQDTAGAALAMANLGDAYRRADNIAKAVESYEGAILKLRQSENWQAFFLATERLTNIYVTQGEYAKAIERLEAAQKTAADIGDVAQELQALDRLGCGHAIMSEKSLAPESLKHAIGCFERGFDLATRSNNDEKRAMFEAYLLRARVSLALIDRVRAG
jgi:tetratricopeptide (TPR) repeat protein